MILSDNKINDTQTNKNYRKPESLVHNPIQQKSQILIVSDSNGRDCVDILNEATTCKSKYIVSSFFKPNATFEEVTSNIHKMGGTFTKMDHIIIFAGITNVLRGKKFDTQKLNNILMRLNNTNVTILSCTYCRNRNILNKFIYEYNVNLVKAARKFNHVRYFETNRILKNENVYNYKPELNYITKKTIFNNVFTEHIRNKYINYDNIIEVVSDVNKYNEYGRCEKSKRSSNSSLDQGDLNEIPTNEINKERESNEIYSRSEENEGTKMRKAEKLVNLTIVVTVIVK